MFDVDNRTKALEKLEAAAAAPDFWNDQEAARDTIGKTNALRSVLNPYAELAQGAEDAELLLELAGEEEDEAQKNAAVKEALGELTLLTRTCEKMELKSLLGDEFDGSNAYLSIHAGAGGTESCDWADMLLRMYRRYSERHGFEVSIMDYQPGDEAGIKSVTFMVTGPFAYGYLKAERGVHRLVRISPFDANKRRHTSFASLDVVAEIDDSVDIEIVESDLRVDTYRSSGAGGQHVNTTDSAVRITHTPTGVVVQCQAERSQHANRHKAMKVLKARLYELEMDKKRKDMERFYGDKGEIGFGHQIRSYVLQPYTMVKDLRTSHETGNVSAVLDGDLDGFIEAYLKARQSNEHTG